MNHDQKDESKETVVDDVRRVREDIAGQHGGDFEKHAEETTRIAEQLRAKLKIRLVKTPSENRARTGTAE
jgi:hypothetical protein